MKYRCQIFGEYMNIQKWPRICKGEFCGEFWKQCSSSCRSMITHLGKYLLMFFTGIHHFVCIQLAHVPFFTPEAGGAGLLMFHGHTQWHEMQPSQKQGVACVITIIPAYQECQAELSFPCIISLFQALCLIELGQCARSGGSEAIHTVLASTITTSALSPWPQPFMYWERRPEMVRKVWVLYMCRHLMRLRTLCNLGSNHAYEWTSSSPRQTSNPICGK